MTRGCPCTQVGRCVCPCSVACVCSDVWSLRWCNVPRRLGCIHVAAVAMSYFLIPCSALALSRCSDSPYARGASVGRHGPAPEPHACTSGYVWERGPGEHGGLTPRSSAPVAQLSSHRPRGQQPCARVPRVIGPDGACRRGSREVPVQALGVREGDPEEGHRLDRKRVFLMMGGWEGPEPRAGPHPARKPTHTPLPGRLASQSIGSQMWDLERARRPGVWSGRGKPGLRGTGAEAWIPSLRAEGHSLSAACGPSLAWGPSAALRELEGEGGPQRAPSPCTHKQAPSVLGNLSCCLPAHSGHPPCLIELQQPLATQRRGHCPRLGGGPGTWPCLHSPQPRALLQDARGKVRQGPGVLMGGPSGHQGTSCLAERVGGQVPPLLSAWAPALCLGSRPAVHPCVRALWGRGRPQLALECESKYSRMATGPVEATERENNCRASSCPAPHTQRGGWCRGTRARPRGQSEWQLISAGPPGPWPVLSTALSQLILLIPL